MVLASVWKEIIDLYRNTLTRERELLPPTKEVWGKVMFLDLCVILFASGCVWKIPSGQTPPWADTLSGQTAPGQTPL